MADSAVENKTEKPSNPNRDPKLIQGKGSNVLNKYRSVTPIFTLAAVSKADVGDPKKWAKDNLDYVILKSGGKGSTGIQYTGGAVSSNTNATMVAGLVGGFNEHSPGRFDLFIDDVEIETLMTPDNRTGMTMATNISFTVFEPYSINGFLEALSVASIAAGYPSYSGATLVLRIEFKGYTDDADLPEPSTVDQSTRYFTITITEMDINVDEKGTKYSVKAVPNTERILGNPSEIKRPISINGNTVEGILSNLIDGVNKQVQEEAKNAGAGKGYDIYKIKFPSWDDAKGWVDGGNDISKSKVTEILKDNTLYKFPDAGTNTKPTANQPTDQTKPTPEQNAKNPEFYKISPSNPVVQFPEGKSINECITAIIRDSHYVREILRKLSSQSEWKSVVKDGLVDYFLIKVEVENQDAIDPDKNKPYQTYTYVITPYKILYTRIPNYGKQVVDSTALVKMSLREYNYIYSGQNIDILNFKLKFDLLYFEAIPKVLGSAINSAPAREAGAKSNKVDLGNVTPLTDSGKKAAASLDLYNKSGLPTAPTMSTAELTDQQKDNGGQTQRDPYYVMAKAMHNAITDSKANLIQGELEILGDPFYLCTGGIGNQNIKPTSNTPRQLENGEAAHTYGEVLVTLNFLNPVDIGPTGAMQFDAELVPFSGVYRVTKCNSKIKDGVFKQSLEVIRQPGQLPAKKVPSNEGQFAPTDPSKHTRLTPNRSDAVTADQTPAVDEAPGQRPDELNLWSQLDRGLPSPGLPGQLSNFTNATGGLGGTVGVVNVSGATSNLAGMTRLSTQVFGGSIPGGQYQPAFGMPLPSKAAVGLQQRVYSPGGYVQAMGMQLANSFGVKGPAAQLLNQFLGEQGRKINQATAVGSGIGVGAVLQLVQNNTDSTTAYGIRSQQLATPPSAIPTTGIATGLNTNALSAVSNMPDSGASLINNAGTNIQSALQGNKADPLAIASLFGVNQSQLSGLSPNLQSKVVGQLENIVSSTPENTDLGIASAQGINLNGLGANGIANLPPTTPYNTAPNPAPDQSFLNQLTARGGLQALARTYGANNVRDVSQDQLPTDSAQTAASNSPSVLNNYLSKLGINNSTDALVLGAKLYAERNSLMGPTGIPGSLEGNFIGVRNQLGPVNIVGDLGSSVVNKFGSKSAGTSPLDKIMIR